MAESKKSTVAVKEPVRLRKAKIANGNESLYLDIYRNGKRQKEYLKLYLIPEKTKEDKDKNKDTLELANSIKNKRITELQTGEFGFTKKYHQETFFLDYYRKMCEERHKTPNTQGNWGNWRSCLRYLEAYTDEMTTFQEITPEWIIGFKDYLNTVEKGKYTISENVNSEFFEPLSQNSKLSYFNKLRACINKAYEDHIIPDNPLRGIEGFKQEEVERAYLTLEEVKLLIATPCKYPYLKNSFLFSCFTGLRKSDIEKLTWGDVQKFGDYTRIVFKQKKTGGQEYLDINKNALKFMGERQKPDVKVFEGFKYGSWTLLELRRWVLAAGITKDITFHCGRHTFAVLMLDLGADIYTVSKLLGHRELQTTQIYAKVLDRKKQEAINLIPDL